MLTGAIRYYLGENANGLYLGVGIGYFYSMDNMSGTNSSFMIPMVLGYKLIFGRNAGFFLDLYGGFAWVPAEDLTSFLPVLSISPGYCF